MTVHQPVGVPYQNPTRYVGPEMDIIPIKRFNRQPLITDKKFRIGQFAILGKNPTTGLEGELWYLSSFNGFGDAIWLQFNAGGGGTGIDFLLTDDGPPAVGPDIGGVVGVLGGTGITTTGQDPATEMMINLDTPVIVADGGSGRSTAIAYSVITGGTVATGPHQSVASVGTANQVLTSNGAGALPSFQNAAGGFGWTEVTFDTASNDAFLIFTGLTGFSEYKFQIEGVLPVTNLAFLRMEFSVDNGAGYLATGYYQSFDDTGNSRNGSFAPLMNSAIGQLNTGGSEYFGWFIFQRNTDGNEYLAWNGAGSSASNIATENNQMSGTNTSAGTDDSDALRFSYNTGNISVGTIRVFGR